jgi:hypothetical protein
MKNKLIRILGLKGSWSWAKKQMMQGKIVYCKHWNGCIKLKIDDKNNTLLQHCFWREGLVKRLQRWETSNHHLTWENFTDYQVFNPIL